MTNTIWNKRMPTFVGILFLVIGIGATSLFVNQGTTFLTRASGETTPKNVTISNLSSTSASVSFTTEPAVVATLSYQAGDEKTEEQTDVRDGSGPTPRRTHFFTIINLTPGSSYTFTIQSGADTYTQDANTPFTITTPQTKSETSNDYKIDGKLLLPDGEVGKDSIIYFSSDKTSVTSTVAGIDGTFSLELKQPITKDKQDIAVLTDDDVFLLVGTNGELQTEATFNIAQASPLPNLTLSSNYNFSSAFPTPVINQVIPVETFPGSEVTETTEVVSITSPRSGQKLTDSKPVFQGTARANENVDLTIDTDDPITARVLTNKEGKWTYRPTNNLPPGNYSISIKARDNDRVLKSASASFTISN